MTEQVYTPERALQIANDILTQLGGNKFVMMVGARNLVHHPEGALSLAFKMFPKANYLKVTLNAMDTYDMKFLKVTKKGFAVHKEFTNLYNDQLQEIFKEVTGLNTHL